MGQLHSTSNVGKLDRSDIIVVVAGQSGVGKSTFINSFAGKQILPIRQSNKSETRDIQYVGCTIPNNNSSRRIVLVELPGIGLEQDSKVEKKINTWIKKLSSNKLEISCVIYLHRILDQFSTIPMDVLRRLCEDSMSKFPDCIALVTTMWDQFLPDESVTEQEKLLENTWNINFLSENSPAPQVMRFEANDSKSATSVLKRVVGGLNSEVTTREIARERKAAKDAHDRYLLERQRRERESRERKVMEIMEREVREELEQEVRDARERLKMERERRIYEARETREAKDREVWERKAREALEKEVKELRRSEAMERRAREALVMEAIKVQEKEREEREVLVRELTGHNEDVGVENEVQQPADWEARGREVLGQVLRIVRKVEWGERQSLILEISQYEDRVKELEKEGTELRQRQLRDQAQERAARRVLARQDRESREALRREVIKAREGEARERKARDELTQQLRRALENRLREARERESRERERRESLEDKLLEVEKREVKEREAKEVLEEELRMARRREVTGQMEMERLKTEIRKQARKEVREEMEKKEREAQDRVSQGERERERLEMKILDAVKRETMEREKREVLEEKLREAKEREAIERELRLAFEDEAREERLKVREREEKSDLEWREEWKEKERQEMKALIETEAFEREVRRVLEEKIKAALGEELRTAQARETMERKEIEELEREVREIRQRKETARRMWFLQDRDGCVDEA